MTAGFTIVSVLITVALMLWALNRHVPEKRDVKSALLGYLLILAITGGLGLAGILSDFSRFPPPLMLFVAGMLLTAGWIILSPWGGRIVEVVPLRVLIGLQGFRVLPEIMLDLAYREGLAPIQMTWHGRNFDILAAVSAILVDALWPRLRQPRRWAWLQWLLAFGLLLNIVIVSILSAPVPFRVFMNEPANAFVAYFPYIWLPGLHVLTALVLHGLALRSLLRRRS